MEQLDQRKQTILTAIIKNYLETGEPVGSRTISKYTDLNLSSATIRNEMADLEEMGYIVQPHASAGRIPSDKGYRFYVDTLLDEKDREVSEMKEFLIERVDKVETMLQQMVKLLAVNTNYTTMITAPKYNKNKVKFIQLSKLDNKKLLIVVVVEGNIIKNTIVELDEELDDDAILKLNILCNTTLNGLSVGEINLSVITRLKEQAGEYSGIVASVLDAVAEAIATDDLEIYTSGTTNIFKYPELSDQQRASELICALEEKKGLSDLIADFQEENKDIQVYIGSEMPVKTMQDCSAVTATYELGAGIQGTIGIIGPKRMDYEKVMDALKTLMAQLDDIFKKT